MSKEMTPLEALERIKKWFPFKVNELEYQNICIIETALKGHEKKTKLAKEYKDVNNVAKRLKALRIIKDTLPIDEEDFYYDDITDKYFFVGNEISKDKYDLLKEVLL